MKNKVYSIHLVLSPAYHKREFVIRAYVLRGHVSKCYEISVHSPTLNMLGRLEDQGIVHTASEIYSDTIDLFYRASAH